jgi:hypothetical protein
MSENTMPQKVYMVKFASDTNDDWRVSTHGLYKSEESAVKKVYSLIIKCAYLFLNKQANEELDREISSEEESDSDQEKEISSEEESESNQEPNNTTDTKSSEYKAYICPKTIEELDNWCGYFSHDWNKYRGRWICEYPDDGFGWGWDISLEKIND